MRQADLFVPPKITRREYPSLERARAVLERAHLLVGPLIGGCPIAVLRGTWTTEVPAWTDLSGAARAHLAGAIYGSDASGDPREGPVVVWLL